MNVPLFLKCTYTYSVVVEIETHDKAVSKNRTEGRKSWQTFYSVDNHFFKDFNKKLNRKNT